MDIRNCVDRFGTEPLFSVILLSLFPEIFLAFSHRFHTLTENLIFSMSDSQLTFTPEQRVMAGCLQIYIESAFWDFFKELVVTPPPASTFAIIQKLSLTAGVCNNLNVIFGCVASDAY